MPELEERLNAVLNDPEQMGRIARMASQLMGSIAPEPSAAPAAPAAPALPEGMLGLMQKLQGGGNTRQLLQALSPYLSARRRARLEKALRVAGAAKLAGAALAQLGGDGDEPL